jgi:hypothetical protein
MTSPSTSAATLSRTRAWRCSPTAAIRACRSCNEQGRTPHKKPRKAELTDEQRRGNRELARRRVVVEHVIRCLKIFRILAERYRNRRKRFSLRFNLIAGLYNYELSLG